MAPTAFTTSRPTHPIHIARSLSYLFSRATDSNSLPPLASVFALIVRQQRGIAPRDILSRSVDTFTSSSTSEIFHPAPALSKRQGQYILAIPTTYQGLNDGPPPGTVAGITLGAIGGFVLVLFLVLSLLRLYAGRTFVETKIIERRDHHHHKSRSPRSERRSRSRSMSEVPRMERQTTVVEERIRRERVTVPDEVVVEEDHDDIVEVIEEHSPERRQSRRESKRTSGFRTVDPAEFGGGSRPMRKVSRR